MSAPLPLGAESPDILEPLLASIASPAPPQEERVAGGVPPLLVSPRLNKRPDVGEVLRVALVRSANRLLREDPGVRHGGDAEAVHQARVATRRLRSDLRTYGAVLEAPRTTSLREELRWLGELLGRVRDLDVLRDHLTGMASGLAEEDRPGAAVLLRRIDREREDARARLLGAMQAERYHALLERLTREADDPPLLDAAHRLAGEGLPPLMREPWKELRRAMRDLGPSSTDAELHRARIRAKRARYAAESMQPVYGARARAFAEAAADLQGVLGDYRDAAVAGWWLRAAATEAADPAVAFAAGGIAAVASQLAARERVRWPAAWRRVARKRVRFWT